MVQSPVRKTISQRPYNMLLADQSGEIAGPPLPCKYLITQNKFPVPGAARIGLNASDRRYPKFS